MHEQVLEKLNELRAFGLPLPQDLLDLEVRVSNDLKEAGRIHKLTSSDPETND
jgi:hypothetical protein